MGAERLIVDVGDDDFEGEVLDRSADTPVVVDFWAPWCAPCRALGPVLERLVAEHAGEVVLARVNVDAAPQVSARFGIRGIPAVLGFRDGVLVAEFTGAQPEAVIRQFLAYVLPSEADRRVREAEIRLTDGDLVGAEERLRRALETDAHHGRALFVLARLLADRSEFAEALALLDRILPSAPVAAEAERFAAELRTRAETGGGDEAALRRRLAANPGDVETRIDLGRVLAVQRRYEAALDELLAAVREDPHYDDDAARKAMVDIFTVLGPDDPLTARFQGELAKALYR
jgi:putative thioredoxin